jgi:hypothetical protein
VDSIRIAIYTYDDESDGALNWKNALENQFHTSVGWLNQQSKPLFQRGVKIICWGKVKPPTWKVPFSARVFNGWFTDCIKANKLKAFKAFQEAGVNTVPWTTSDATAIKWLQESSVVIARTKLSADNSKGIVVIEPSKTLFGHIKQKQFVSYAKLYTKFVPHTHEYRVHVMRTHYVDGLEKKRLPSCAPYIFDQTHGLFCRDNVYIPTKVKDISIAAVKAVGLDFGAVDVIWNAKQSNAYVLEVNSAPGLLPSEARNYTKIFHTHGYI